MSLLNWMMFVIVEALHLSSVLGAKLPDIYWNQTNPIFRIDNTDHIIDVNMGNSVFEYDQVNIVCPKHDQSTPEESTEKYIIYNVSKEEYETCSITDFSKARIIARCNKPYQSMCFTITFRSFTPQPGGLEFRPGMDYFFIAAPENLREGENHCLTKNMRVQFKICCKKDDEQLRLPTSTTSTTTTTTTTTPSTDDNSVYPFYRFPPITDGGASSAGRFPSHARNEEHHRSNGHHRGNPLFPTSSSSSHETRTVDYWPQYPHVPGSNGVAVGGHQRKHHDRERHFKRPKLVERPLADETGTTFGSATNHRNSNNPRINSIDTGRLWPGRAKKEELINSANDSRRRGAHQHHLATLLLALGLVQLFLWTAVGADVTMR